MGTRRISQVFERKHVLNCNYYGGLDAAQWCLVVVGRCIRLVCGDHRVFLMSPVVEMNQADVFVFHSPTCTVRRRRHRYQRCCC